MTGKIIAILGILVTACGLLFATSIANFVGDKVTTGVEKGLEPITKQIPNGDKIIQSGEIADDIESKVGDLNNAKQVAKTGSFKSTMSFGMPVMIVVVAGIAIWSKIRS